MHMTSWVQIDSSSKDVKTTTMAGGGSGGTMPKASTLSTQLCKHKKTKRTTTTTNLVADLKGGNFTNFPKHSPTGVRPPVIISKSIIVVLIIFSIIITNQIRPTTQQLLCPKVCHCDEQTLETVCRGSILTSGIPLILNPSTKRIAINHANITVFSTLDYIKNLETLDLAHNKIAAIDFVHINSNGNLISLNASHNNLSELKDSTVSAAISKLESSSSFNTSPTNFNSDESEKIRALRKSKISVLELILSYNHLTILKNFTFLRWVRLQRLELSYNSLVSLEPDSLFGLTKLKHLNLRGNHLIQVPGQALISTTRTLISNSLPNDMVKSQLKTLDLSENAIVALDPESFISLGQLQELYLESCSLQSVDERAFNDLINLNVLSMSHNDLTEVPTDSFATLSLLKQLVLDFNRIHQLRPNAFRNLAELEELHIKNGSLREIQQQALAGLKSLKRLDLAYNSNLTKVYTDLLDDLPKLVHLNFYMCALPSLPRETSLNEENVLTFLDLRGNPLECGCQLKWLTKWLARLRDSAYANATQLKTSSDSVVFQDHVKNYITDAKLTTELINITCSKPAALAGKPVIDLPDNKLECIRPTSSLNLHIGFASLFIMTLLLITACLVNLNAESIY